MTEKKTPKQKLKEELDFIDENYSWECKDAGDYEKTQQQKLKDLLYVQEGKLKDLLDVQHDQTHTNYYRGLYNGLLCAYATLGFCTDEYYTTNLKSTTEEIK